MISHLYICGSLLFEKTKIYMSEKPYDYTHISGLFTSIHHNLLLETSDESHPTVVQFYLHIDKRCKKNDDIFINFTSYELK